MSDGLIILAVVIVLVAVAVALLWVRNSRSRRLQERFGPEYDRAVEQAGGRGSAERELRDRELRRQRIHVVPLDPADRDRYLETWQRTQARFVDAPEDATRQADRLVAEVMRARGYPVEDFEQRAADLSVDYPGLVENYRAARAIASANDRSAARTEDLRQALVHYRSLFEELLAVSESQPAEHPAEHSVREER